MFLVWKCNAVPSNPSVFACNATHTVYKHLKLFMPRNYCYLTFHTHVHMPVCDHFWPDQSNEVAVTEMHRARYLLGRLQCLTLVKVTAFYGNEFSIRYL